MAAGRSPRKAEAVNDERWDRDRVTAILRLLEALDTIDRLEGENAQLRQMGVTHGRQPEVTITARTSADPWWQALNEGNE